jgi:hypothetical protein
MPLNPSVIEAMWDRKSGLRVFPSSELVNPGVPERFAFPMQRLEEIQAADDGSQGESVASDEKGS